MDFYHVLNRGVEKRTIFLDDHDRNRFLKGLKLFNTNLRIDNTSRAFDRLRKSIKTERPLVDIHGWCLMDNHYHLLLSEHEEGGIRKFLQKLNIGYAKYFNERHKRVGTLFQGRTKKVHISNDAHFRHILHYIHLNPLDFLAGSQQWREFEIKNATQALEHLENYRWSSYADYCDRPSDFPITFTRVFKEIFNDYPKELKKYLHNLETDKLAGLTLE